MNNQNSTSKKLVVNTIWKTLVVLVLAIFVLFCIGSLAFPAFTGNFCYTIGLKKTSSWLSLKSAQKTEVLEDYYTALVRSVDGKCYKNVSYCTYVMLNPTDDQHFSTTYFDSFVSNKDDEMDLDAGSTKNYIYCNAIYANVRLKKDNDETIWNLAKSYCKNGAYYYYGEINPVASYINAIIDMKNVDCGDILTRLKNMNEETNTSGTLIWRKKVGSTESAESFMIQDVKRLIDAKHITSNDDVAYTYWMNLINN